MQLIAESLEARLIRRLEGYRTRLQSLDTLVDEEMRQQHNQRRMHYLRFLHQERCVFGFAASELEALLQHAEEDLE